MIHGTKLSVLALVVFAWTLVCGCGQTTHSLGSAPVRNRSNQYKGQDAELVQASNKIPVYSSPESARRALNRQPDQTITDDNGVVTQYYKSDDTPNAERLRLRYSNNRLIGKEIIPPDPNVASNTNGNVQVYGSNNMGTFSATPQDTANARFNNDFNSKLNTNNVRR